MLVFCILGLLSGSSMLHALTVNQLLNERKMTPKKFANYFENFRFEDRMIFDVQSPHQFLSKRSGDCIDYAVLADHVLSHHGYQTRLIRVEMVGLDAGHAVCYVNDDRVYLDYNNRKYFFNLTRSGATIRQVATKIAASFDANWTFAQEFAFDYDSFYKRVIHTVVKIEPPSTDPDVLAPKKPNPASNS